MPSKYPVIKPRHMPRSCGFLLVHISKRALPLSNDHAFAAFAADASNKKPNIQTAKHARFICTFRSTAMAPVFHSSSYVGCELTNRASLSSSFALRRCPAFLETCCLHSHPAIFRFLEIAPVEPLWVWVVYDVLGRVDPQQACSPERIDHVLERWGGLKIGGYKEGQEMQGNLTHLPITQELPCYIAALYGRGFAEVKSVHFGSTTAKDIALRCAYYARGDLTKRDMKAGYKRDKFVYLFAASFNSSIIRNRKLRQFFEKEQFGGSELYLKHFAAVKKKYPYIDELSEELKAEARSRRPEFAKGDRRLRQ
jgi:hypothetical protein